VSGRIPRVNASQVTPVPFAQRNGKEDFNASGVAQVGVGRFVFTDNNDPGALFELVVDPTGNQSEPIARRPLTGLPRHVLSDPEGLARLDVDGEIVLVVASSLAVKKKTGHDGLVRVRYRPEGDLTAEAMPGFRDWLLRQYPELAKAAGRAADKGGLNIEGIAWDPGNSTLLFGVRSPVDEAGIPVLRVQLDARAPWTVDALSRSESSHLTKHQAGQGIRDLTHDPVEGGFLVLLGRSVSGDDVPFQLCRWDGVSTSVDVQAELPQRMKPEGVSVIQGEGPRRVLVVGDTGSFASLHLS